jgi:hypothetical protein
MLFPSIVLVITALQVVERTVPDSDKPNSLSGAKHPILVISGEIVTPPYPEGFVAFAPFLRGNVCKYTQ